MEKISWLFLILSDFIIYINSLSTHPLVLIVSFDGFRYDYLSKTDTPNFDKLITGGVKAKWTTDVFATRTFPNHITLVSGLYEESHGIVGNSFYDPALNDTFSPTRTESEWFDVGAEPVWITNQICNRTKVPESDCKTRRSGIVFWVGSETAIKGIRPFRYLHYNSSMPFFERVDLLINWLTDKEQPINFGALYFHEPDHTGHQFGPDSPEVVEKIRLADTVVGYLVNKLTEVDAFQKINMIITSDHGMATTSPDRTVILNDFVNPSWYKGYGLGGPNVLIQPNEGFGDVVYNALKAIAQLTVYKKSEMPEYFHYKHNIRVSDLIITAEENWVITMDERTSQHGTHGYDNRLMSMHPFFIAHGPAFKQGFVSEPFSSVNVYPLMCELLGMNPGPNNGSISNVKHLLRQNVQTSSSSSLQLKSFSSLIGILVGAFASALLVTGVIVLTRHICNKRRNRKLTIRPIRDIGYLPLDTDVRSPLLKGLDIEEA